MTQSGGDAACTDCTITHAAGGPATTQPDANATHGVDTYVGLRETQPSRLRHSDHRHVRHCRDTARRRRSLRHRQLDQAK